MRLWDCGVKYIGKWPRCHPMLSLSISVGCPFTDSSTHLLVADKMPLINVTLGLLYGDKKRYLISHVSVIDIIWETVDSLKN